MEMMVGNELGKGAKDVDWAFEDTAAFIRRQLYYILDTKREIKGRAL